MSEKVLYSFDTWLPSVHILFGRNLWQPLREPLIFKTSLGIETQKTQEDLTGLTSKTFFNAQLDWAHQ